MHTAPAEFATVRALDEASDQDIAAARAACAAISAIRQCDFGVATARQILAALSAKVSASYFASTSDGEILENTLNDLIDDVGQS